MLYFIAASVLLWSADALLFPNNNGNEPEPELLIACPPPAAPQFGSIKCDYSLFDLTCTVMCDSGFTFATGSNSFNYKCDLFDGLQTGAIPRCNRIGGVIVNPTKPPVVVGPTSGTGSVIGIPSTATNCVRSLNDCLSRQTGDYAYCDNCRMFATCAASGFYVRDCPGISVFNAKFDKCTEITDGACRIV